jgi:methionine synthase II (cobalamin-independent)
MLMKHGAQKIRTSHVGRLPAPAGFVDTAARLARGEVGDDEVAARVVPVVAEVVKRQVEIGLDCIGDGEYWSAIGIKSFDLQMTGLGTRPLRPGEVAAMRESTRERDCGLLPLFRSVTCDAKILEPRSQSAKSG